MKKTLLLIFSLLLIAATLTARSTEPEKKILRGYDGGMMLHAGWLKGQITPLDYTAMGATIGIGGVLRLHLGGHFRFGSEGYVSTMKQLGNGSYIKCGWGGILGDFYWQLKRFKPYVGITLGGGSVTDYLMFDGNAEDWEVEDKAYFHKEPFFAIDPFIGCEYKVTEALHLSLKIDCLNAIGGEGLHMPVGPRIYFGFIFNH